VKVLFHGSVQELTHGEPSHETAEVRDVRGLIDELGESFGAAFREFLVGDQTCFILVNGNGLMMTGGYDTPLHNGDTVDILPFITEG